MDIENDIATVEFDDVELEDILDDLVKEIELSNHRIIKILNIDNIYERKKLVKGLKIGFKKYKIVEFCNLFTCAGMVTEDLLVGVFMPQRFCVYQPINERTVYISYLKPSVYAKLFKNKALQKIADKLNVEMKNVLEAVEN